MLQTIVWPIVVLTLGLVSIFIFRKPLVEKISCITRAGKDGVLFEQQPDRVPEPEIPMLLSHGSIMKAAVSESVVSREIIIEENIKHFSEEEKISALTREFARTKVSLEFQNISHLIFGSQSLLLEILSSVSDGVPISQANDQFLLSCEKFPEIHKERTFEHWLGFLTAYFLIVVNDDDLVFITQFGKDFLKHLIDTNTYYNRLG
ncbi:MAG: hypothetical protein ACI8ZB_005029 [Desulforhopalus sp.]|jgi:hypothetical protein